MLKIKDDWNDIGMFMILKLDGEEPVDYSYCDSIEEAVEEASMEWEDFDPEQIITSMHVLDRMEILQAAKLARYSWLLNTYIERV